MVDRIGILNACPEEKIVYVRLQVLSTNQYLLDMKFELGISRQVNLGDTKKSQIRKLKGFGRKSLEENFSITFLDSEGLLHFYDSLFNKLISMNFVNMGNGRIYWNFKNFNFGPVAKFIPLVNFQKPSKIETYES
jgi:hypothetical protein